MAKAETTKGSWTWPVALATLLCGAPAAAATPTQIVNKAIDNQVFSLPGAEMQMAMHLRNRRGKERLRKLFSRTLQQGGLNRTLTRFISPADVRGTSFLFIENKGREDDQHMYLPALKMVRRIAGTEKNASFMGSDFSYADMESRDLEQAKHKKLPDEKIGKTACHVIEAIPNNKSAYSKIRVWIRKKDNVFMRTRFFDTKGRLLKEVFVKKIKRAGDRKVPALLKVEQRQNGHSTLLEITAIKLRSDLTKGEFTLRALKKQ
jgi:hypothetical protein